MKKIILVDFSKVISPIWISKFLSSNLEPYLNIDKNTIRDIYKKNIGKLVIWEYSIFSFLDLLVPHLKKWYSLKDLKKQIHLIPTIDENILDFILLLKKDYEIYLVSDVYKELWEKIENRLSKFFDKFIFSFIEWLKKSNPMFWEKISNTIDMDRCILFIDDKKENISLARKYGIDWIIYEDLEKSKYKILGHVYKKYENILLWSWAAWILYSYFLHDTWKKDMLVLEKEWESFWLMKSYKIGQSYYDLWWHALHDNNERIKNFLQTYGKTSHFRQKRKAYIDYQDRYIPFPFQLHLKYLDEDERKECFEWFMYSYINNKNKKAACLDEFLRFTFGEWIYRCFLRDYNRKIRKTDLNNIAINWNERISYESLDTFLHGYLEKNEENYWTNSYVNYPINWWYQEYLKAFYADTKSYILHNTIIKSIDIENKIIRTNRWIFIYENIISTIPLNNLMELMNLDFDKKIFEYLSLQIVAILTEKNHPLEKQRIYNKDWEYFFHKCAINSNSSDFLRNKNEYVFQFESSFKYWKKIKKELLIDNYIGFLENKKIISSRKDIIEIQYREVKYWYPIQTKKLMQNKASIKKKLENYNIYPLWRFWNWEYINFDKVILNAIQLFNEKENENIVI